MVERLCLARKRKPARQNAAPRQSALHTGAHRRPYGAQMVVDVRLIVPHIGGQGHVVCGDERLDLVKVPLRVDFAALRERHTVDHHAAAAHRKRGEQLFSVLPYGVEVELIRMRKVSLFRVENDLGVRAQHLAQHTVGAVPAPGQRQRPVEHRAIVPPPVDRQCVFRNALRSDRVRAGRSAPDAIEFFQRFHGSAPCVFFCFDCSIPARGMQDAPPHLPAFSRKMTKCGKSA